MEFERYEDVIDAFERDNMGYETLTDYINGNNIKIAEIDMNPMGDLERILNKGKDGGLMVAVQKFNQGGKAYDPRASVEDMAKAIQKSSAGTDNQKLRMLMDYSMSMNPQATPQTAMANQGKMEKLLGLQTNPNFNYMKPSGPAMLMPMMAPQKDPGYFGNEGIMINGKRYMSEDEAIEDMGIETYNRFMATGGMAGGKTYHQYHDQYVPRDEESMGYANGGGVGSMMQPKKNFKMQGGVRNYLGKQKEVKAPLNWQSSPDHPKTELAYITPAEKDLLVKKDLHGSLKGGVNRGPSGIMSLNGWGSSDPGQNRAGQDISSGMDKSGSDKGWSGPGGFTSPHAKSPAELSLLAGKKGSTTTMPASFYGKTYEPEKTGIMSGKINPLSLIGALFTKNPLGILGSLLGKAFTGLSGKMRGINPITGEPNTQAEYEAMVADRKTQSRIDNLTNRMLEGKTFSQTNLDNLLGQKDRYGNPFGTSLSNIDKGRFGKDSFAVTNQPPANINVNKDIQNYMDDQTNFMGPVTGVNKPGGFPNQINTPSWNVDDQFLNENPEVRNMLGINRNFNTTPVNTNTYDDNVANWRNANDVRPIQANWLTDWFSGSPEDIQIGEEGSPIDNTKDILQKNKEAAEKLEERFNTI